MSQAELPGIPAALGLVLFAAPLVGLTLGRALRVLPRRAVIPHSWPFVEVFLVFAAPFAALSVLATLLTRPGETREAGAAVLLDLLGTQLVLGTAAALAVVLAARRPNGLASLGLTVGAARGVFASVVLAYLPAPLLFAGLGIVWAHVCRAIGWDERQEILRLILALDARELALAAGVAVLLGPLIEELLFRGFLQPFLGQFVGERGGLVLASLLFAGLHGVAGLPILFALSLFLGWLKLRTRSLWVPWFAHALNNAVTLGLALAFAPQ